MPKELTLEELHAQILDMKDKLDATTQEKEVMIKELEERNARVKSLEEHNQKMFVKMTSNVDIQSKSHDANEESVLLGEYSKYLDDDELDYFLALEEENNIK